ncbi:Snf7-domain-containing protein [Zopfochytrium polystomum]|nr:Snf7-domain-containing protein [Zopfochytrium polystomum]
MDDSQSWRGEKKKKIKNETMSSSSFIDSIFGKRLTPEEQVRKWRQSIRAQERELDKQLRGIATEEGKAKMNIKAAAKRKDYASCKILAKEVARSRRARDRIHASKAQLNSLVMQLQQQMAAAKIAGTLKKSTDIMKTVNQLIKLPEIAKTMQEMSMEMTKAGIIGEMMDDAIDSLDEEGIEEEAEEEVDKILFELTDGLLGEAGSVGAPVEAPESKEEEAEPEVDTMQARLAALRSA